MIEALYATLAGWLSALAGIALWPAATLAALTAAAAIAFTLPAGLVLLLALDARRRRRAHPRRQRGRHRLVTA